MTWMNLSSLDVLNSKGCWIVVKGGAN